VHKLTNIFFLAETSINTSSLREEFEEKIQRLDLRLAYGSSVIWQKGEDRRRAGLRAAATVGRSLAATSCPTGDSGAPCARRGPAHVVRALCLGPTRVPRRVFADASLSLAHTPPTRSASSLRSSYLRLRWMCRLSRVVETNTCSSPLFHSSPPSRPWTARSSPPLFHS
jgi:hypothetical protein